MTSPRKPWVPPTRSVYDLVTSLNLLGGIWAGQHWASGYNPWSFWLAVVLVFLLFARATRREVESERPTGEHPLQGVYPELDADAPEGSVAFLLSTGKWYDKVRGNWRERNPAALRN